MSITELAIIALCLALGGLVKGATGAGAPIFAVPALATMFNVPFAVVIMVVPNLVSNIWQVWQQRAHRPGTGFLVAFVGAGAVGTAAGTWVLTALPSDTLSLGIALVVFFYIGLRLARPHWKLDWDAANRLALPAGLVGGVLQGATGISAPISITFLNAIRLARPMFMFTISCLFIAFVLVQIPGLALAGILTLETATLSTAAVLPLLAAMPLGGALARRLPPAAFDRLILGFLALLAIKLVVDALF